MYPEYTDQPSYFAEQPHGEDERFFPFIPFLGGLAIGGLLFNRPPYPYPYPAPYPVPYPSQAYPAYPAGAGFGGGYPMPFSQQQMGFTENINIYSRD